MMKTLITPPQVLSLAFGEGTALSPQSLTQADIASAEHRYLRPLLGEALHERLLAGEEPAFVADYLAAPLAIFTRVSVQPKLDIQAGACGTTAPKSSWYQPADHASRREALGALRREGRSLLRRACDYLEANADRFPDYDPTKNPLKRCAIHGNLVQTP